MSLLVTSETMTDVSEFTFAGRISAPEDWTIYGGTAEASFMRAYHGNDWMIGTENTEDGLVLTVIGDDSFCDLLFPSPGENGDVQVLECSPPTMTDDEINQLCVSVFSKYFSRI